MSLLHFAQIIVKFQSVLYGNLGKPVNLVLIQAFSVLVSDLMEALVANKDGD